MAQGSNLTSEHQAKAGRANAGIPRVARVPRSDSLIPRNPEESLEEAVVRYQRAKATNEELDSIKLDLAIKRESGELIPANDSIDSMEALNLRWVAELEQLPHSVATDLPAEIAGIVREQVRTAVENACLAMRLRLGSDT